MQRNVTTTYYRDGMAGTSDDVECILPEMPADLVIAALRSNAPIRDIAKAAGLAGASLKRAEPRLRKIRREVQPDGCPRVADSNSAVRAIAAARAMHLAVQNTEESARSTKRSTRSVNWQPISMPLALPAPSN
jgi:hypothetical protein